MVRIAGTVRRVGIVRIAEAESSSRHSNRSVIVAVDI
jgi:hypothetical protein